MQILNGIILTLIGLAAMGMGLYLFYALLPFFYAMFGAGVGYWLATLISNSTSIGGNALTLVFAIGGAVIFAGCAYYLEPVRRMLIGIGLGSLLGGLIASALGITGFLGVIFMAAGGLIGIGISIAIFDTFIVMTSALGGAGLAMDGLHMILPFMDMLDRTNISPESMTPWIIWIVAGLLGMGWQFSNLRRWATGGSA